ncbi:MAG: hypothetical protein ACKVXR_14085, partial [Planctomycetota bacterium]
GKLKRVTVSGAPPVALADCPPGWAAATWSRDGSILIDLTESTEEEGWYLVEPGASSARKIRGFPKDREIGPDKAFPSFLPDGRHFLFTQPNEGKPYLQLGSLDTEETRRLAVAGSMAQFVKPGYVLYVRDGVLLAHAFDVHALELTGEALEIERGVDFFAPTGHAGFTASQEGTLVLEKFGPGAALKWFDREGREVETVLPPDQHVEQFDLAPDGKHVVYCQRDGRDGTTDLWLLDLDRKVPSRLTSAPRGEYSPCFDPSGKRIAFDADWKGPPNVYLMELASATSRELVPFDRHVQRPGSFTPDGAALLYSANSSARDADVWVVDIASGDRREFLATEFRESQPGISPDGRHVAFTSNASGRSEVYLVPFADGSDRLRLSSNGGVEPQWSAGGKELFFESLDDAILSVAIDVDGEGRVRADRPKVLIRFAEGALQDWRVTRDGQRFLVTLRDAEDASAADDVLVDWPRLLAKEER